MELYQYGHWFVSRAEGSFKIAVQQNSLPVLSGERGRSNQEKRTIATMRYNIIQTVIFCTN